MKRLTTIPCTGAGSMFIRLGELPPHLRDNIAPLNDGVNVHNESGKLVPKRGSINLIVPIGRSLENVRFLVADKLSTAVILGCTYGEKHVDAILPRLKIVRMDDGSTVPIMRHPLTTQTDVPVPEEQQFYQNKKRESPKSKVTERVKLQPRTQS